MRIILESTEEIAKINGVPARLWEGKTEGGISCFAMICKIGVHKNDDSKQFEKELKECVAPTITRGFGGTNFIFDGEN